MNEITYQNKLIKKLQVIFPGCFVLKNDPSRNQGLPDLLILFRDQWAMLEVKMSANSRVQPNQQHYVDLFGEMSYCAFIYPEIEEGVMRDLQSTFGAYR